MIFLGHLKSIGNVMLFTGSFPLTRYWLGLIGVKVQDSPAYHRFR
jgi:hypothetical protein